MEQGSYCNGYRGCSCMIQSLCSKGYIGGRIELYWVQTAMVKGGRIAGLPGYRVHTATVIGGRIA